MEQFFQVLVAFNITICSNSSILLAHKRNVCFTLKCEVR